MATRDANGNVNSNVFNGGGQLVQENHADGGFITHRYDAFGNRISTTDAVGNDSPDSAVTAAHTTSRTFDLAGRVLSLFRPTVQRQ